MCIRDSVDYVPLFALLGSQLTDAEVKEIADELANAGDLDSAHAIRDAIDVYKRQRPDADRAGRPGGGLLSSPW